jgi:hypothetical protein
MLQKFEINYQEMWFELRNKLCHWSFFKFKKEFELKIRGSKGVDIFEFELRHLGNSKTIQTWPIILLLHLVQFEIISMV